MERSFYTLRSRAAGFRAPVAASRQPYAVMTNFRADRLGPEFLRGGSPEARFIKPGVHGDVLTPYARVNDEDGLTLQAEAWTENRQSWRVMVGNALLSKAAR